MQESEFGGPGQDHQESKQKRSMASETLRYFAKLLPGGVERIGLEGPNIYHLEDMLKAVAEEFQELELSPVQEKLLDATISELRLRSLGELEVMKAKGLDPKQDRNEEDPFLGDHINATMLRVYEFLAGIKSRGETRAN